MTFFLEKLAEFFQYTPDSPMLFNSGMFLLLFTVFISIYAFVYPNPVNRILYIIGFSLLFYYKSSGWYVGLFMGTIIVTYYFALQIDKEESVSKRRSWLILAILFNVIFLLYFKYTNFLLANLSALTQAKFYKLDIFLPIGISFYTFQAISYLVDVKQRHLIASKSVLDFVFYMTFFPHLVAGPIVRAKDFLPQVRQKLLFTQSEMGEGLFLIVKGLIKKAIIADYMAQYVDLVYKNPSGFSGFENLMAMYAYTLQIYCDFSGYSDMAIGIALILGYRLKENFRSPYNSLDITEFWRRWHISLSTWLRDYIYIPLGGNRYGEERQWLFLFLTMLIGGFWHGADWKFIFWGAMHGLALLIHKIFSKTAKEMEWNQAIIRPLGWVLTFHFVAFLWIFFRADSFNTALLSIAKITLSLDFAYFLPFIQTNGLLFCLMIFGYWIHFTGEKDKSELQRYYSTLPMYAKAISLIVVIQLILQIQSENVQPFIYFQF
jgi:D-alanyl-lipoteichoic acid acyltransferase DltB (MBOAT superfamily)